MKNILIIITLLLTVISCTNYNSSSYCYKGAVRILNKKKSTCARGGGWCYFSFYLYDGKEAYWSQTDELTYNFFNTNDTLPTLIIVKTVNNKIK